MPEADTRPDDTLGQETARRRLPAPQRRQLILQAALRTFAERGYDGAAMEQIAVAAGVSKAVVYDHVSSKQELYTQVLDAIRVELERTVVGALAPAGIEGEQRVRNAIAAVFRYVDERPESARLLLHELQGANASAIGRMLEQRIAAELARALGEQAGIFRDHPRRERQLQILAELIKAAVQGLIAWWFRNPAVARDELVERCTAVVWPAIERVWAPPADG